MLVLGGFCCFSVFVKNDFEHCSLKYDGDCNESISIFTKLILQIHSSNVFIFFGLLKFSL